MMNQTNKLIMPSTSTVLGQKDSHIHWLTENIGIHHQAVQDYQAMQKAALNEQIKIHIISGFRSFERQLHIWNNKYLAKLPVKDQAGQCLDMAKLSEKEKVEAILLFSALPGASRHHWGSDIDVYDPRALSNQQRLQLEPWEYSETGPFFTLSQWLQQHSQEFGFYFPYDSYRGGVAAEPWHLSYQPLAQRYQQSLTIDVLASRLSEVNIQGKNSILKHIEEIYEKYIINVNPVNQLIGKNTYG